LLLPTLLYRLLGNSTLAEIRSLHPKGIDYSDPALVYSLINDVFFAAREYEKHTNSSMNDVMEALNHTITTPGLLWPRQNLYRYKFISNSFVTWKPDDIVHHAIAWHLIHFLQSKLAASEIEFGYSFLPTALDNWCYHSNDWFSSQSCCDDHLPLLAVLLDLKGCSWLVGCSTVMNISDMAAQSKICSRSTLFSAFKLICQRGLINDPSIRLLKHRLSELFSTNDYSVLVEILETVATSQVADSRKRPASGSVEKEKRKEKKRKKKSRLD